MTRVSLVAHGIGGRLDLPVPVTFFAAGAAVVLIVTFVALAAMWTTPRLQDGPRSETKGLRPGMTWLRVGGVIGLVLALVGGLTALVTGQESVGTRNIAPILLWVFFWLVVPFASVLLGNLYTGINPWRTLSTWLGIGDIERPAPRLGVWPAAIGLVAFAWLELIHPDGGLPATVALAALVYTLYLLVMVGRFGREQGLTSFDIFTPYNRLFSSIGPWGRNDQGQLRLPRLAASAYDHSGVEWVGPASGGDDRNRLLRWPL